MRWMDEFLVISVDMRPYFTGIACREEENLVFCFGALFNSTLNFTQSG